MRSLILILIALVSSASAQPKIPYLEESLARGWKVVKLELKGHRRQLLWKGPAGAWRGAIVVLHGGGGSASNFAAGPRLVRPMVDFSNAAIDRGFAVVALDSNEAPPYGKRWNCMGDGQPNDDLDFIQTVVDQALPQLRPVGSDSRLYLTGISNGGFLATLAATHFGERWTAFAPVSAGDPYGTVMDMTTHPKFERDNAPGVFRDLETGLSIQEPGAARSPSYPHERTWASCSKRPPFKQFHHRYDGVCDLSCMEKARTLLVQHGFSDSGAFVIEGKGRRSLWNHFWQKEYNSAILDFFSSSSAVVPTTIRVPEIP